MGEKVECYEPNTPLPNYPPVGKTPAVLADALARIYGWEKPVWTMQPVNVKDIR